MPNPRIGPKVSTNVPPHVFNNLNAYAKASGIERAQLIRDTLIALFGEEKRYARTIDLTGE